MPRNRRVLQSIYPYHVTIRAINKAPFEMDLEVLWNYTADLLLFCTYAFDIRIQAFVLMSNHYHLLVQTPKANLDKFMNYFNRELSREITYKTGRINQKFGARYHSSIISDLRYFHNVYKYIYRNPVDANICSDVRDYKYSSLNFVIGRDRYRFPVFDTYFEYLEEHWSNLKWLNRSIEKSESKAIRAGLQKTYFSL